MKSLPTKSDEMCKQNEPSYVYIIIKVFDGHSEYMFIYMLLVLEFHQIYYIYVDVRRTHSLTHRLQVYLLCVMSMRWVKPSAWTWKPQDLYFHLWAYTQLDWIWLLYELYITMSMSMWYEYICEWLKMRQRNYTTLRSYLWGSMENLLYEYRV